MSMSASSHRGMVTFRVARSGRLSNWSTVRRSKQSGLFFAFFSTSRSRIGPTDPQSADLLDALRNEITERYLVATFSTPDGLATEVAVAVTRAVEGRRTPHDLVREHRLMREWRGGATRFDRVRAADALTNMGSPRYAAALKELLIMPSGKDDSIMWLTTFRRCSRSQVIARKSCRLSQIS